MKKGYLSQYFMAVAARRLTLVETDKKVSNQHEYNGTKVLKSVFGTFDTNEKVYFSTRFIWMSEGNSTIMADGTLTWYNSRLIKVGLTNGGCFIHRMT